MADISKIKTPDGTEYNIKDTTARSGISGKQATITASGVLIGNGSGGVSSKTLDTSSLTNDNNHVPTSGVVMSAINFVPETGNAGWHNSVYRGKYLGTSVTAAQYAAIDAGTFDDLFIGDYWTIDGVNWRIAHFDYYLHKGDTECTKHHVVIVPDSLLATSVKMNNSNVTTGGYMGSDFYTGNNSNTGRATARNKVTSAFGSAHILTHRAYLTNAVTSDFPSGGAWVDASVELMNEINVYGCYIYTSAMNGTTFPNKITCDHSQFALFAHDPSRICIREYWWLRNVASGALFAIVNNIGTADCGNASRNRGIRPAFAICA